MISFNYWRGALLALLCAGPVMILPLFFTSMPSAGAGAHIGGLIFGIVFSIPFGAMVAFLPILFGGYLMALWGSRNPQARHPALWGMAGAALATPIGVVLTGLERGDPRFWALFAFTGAVCALLVRLGTRWDDGEALPAPLNTDEGEGKRSRPPERPISRSRSCSPPPRRSSPRGCGWNRRSAHEWGDGG